MGELDLLICDGVVVDGTGEPARRVNVGVKDSRVCYMGTDKPASKREIDAAGRYVTPGFVAHHTHYDAQLTWDPWAAPQSGHGVTTYVCGNCGFGLAPLNDHSVEYLLPMLAKVEGIPLKSLLAGGGPPWRTTAQMLAFFDGNVGVNVGFLTGHSTLRSYVMGGRANKDAATRAELDQMKALLRQSIEAGSLGFSSSHAETHLDHEADGVPSLSASHQEILELMSVIKDYEGTTTGYVHTVNNLTPDDKRRLAEISLAAQRPFSWPAIIAAQQSAELSENKLSSADVARKMGGDVRVQCMSTPLRQYLNFKSGFVYDQFPGIWNDLYRLPLAERVRRFRDPAVRVAMEEAARSLAESDNTMAYSAQWESFQIVSVKAEVNRPYAGRLIRDIAQGRGVSAFTALMDIVVEDDLATMMLSTKVIDDSREGWAKIVKYLKDDRTVWGGEDGGAHCDQMELYSHGTRFLENAVRKHGLISLEETIPLFAKVPADFLGLRDRGTLQIGNYADMVIFDLDRIGCGPVEVRSDFPGGGERLYTESEGYDYVIVNGVPIIAAGRRTGHKPGTVMRPGRDTYTVDIRSISRMAA